MAILNDTLISSSIYSSLPLIEEVQHVPSTNLSDLADLRALLTQHQVPLGISIRLIHKHYDVDDGEVRVIRECAFNGPNINGQKRTGNKGIRMFYYQCNDEDKCNSASSLTVAFGVIAAAVALSLRNMNQ